MGLVGGRGNIGSKVATLALALGAFLRARPYAVPHTAAPLHDTSVQPIPAPVKCRPTSHEQPAARQA